MGIFREAQKKEGAVGVFGLPYLDKKLECILANDLVLLGATSGAGKSTLANIISMANPTEKVCLFSLENFEGDAIKQEAYNIYVQETRDFSLTLRQIKSGRHNDKINWEALERAEVKAQAKFSHVRIISRKDGYTTQNLQDDLQRAIDDDFKLIIIDHIDYLDKVDERDNDVMHMSELMKTIRRTQNTDPCGIVAISHLRKSDGKNVPAVPSMDQFYGSSNKVKESTVVVLLAPDYVENENIVQKTGVDYLKSTFCCIRKLRDGGMTNKVGVMTFNQRKGKYDNDFKEKVISYNGEVKEIDKGVENV